ncbi:MAG TPA: hypothetical protein VK509_15190 [Polyangiales bacterium]|nr:hypothetical protein [Polyangiales bacterium]
MSRWCAWVLASGLLCSAAGVRAHPAIDQARVRLEAAEFERALALLDKAEQSPNLSREDALRLLELRALGLLALNDERMAQRALLELCALDPEHTFAPGTSPDLLAAFEKARSRLPPPPRLVIERNTQPDGIALHVHVLGDELGLVRRVELFTRVGGGPWQRTGSERTQLSAATGQRVDYRANALGLGGGVLANAPEQSWSRPEPAPAPAPERVRTGSSPWLYVGLAAGALLLAGATAAVVVATSGDADRTQPSPPRVVLGNTR